MSRRTGITLAVIGLALAVAGILFIASILRQLTNPVPQVAIPTPVTESVLIAAHDVPLGIVLKPEDLTLIQVPLELAPLNSIKTVEGAAGKITAVQLVAGEMIMPHHLVDPTNIANRNLGFALEDNQVLMAFPVTDLMSTLNILKRGDMVDILASLTEQVPVDNALQGQEGETQDKLFTFDALQRVEISAVVVAVADQQQQQAENPIMENNPLATPEPTPIPDPATSTPRALMLALAPQDALVLKHLKDAGAVFDIVLRSPTSTLLFESSPVTDEYLIDRYELILIP